MLCTICENFDIQSLYAQCLARESHEAAVLPVHGKFKEYAGFPRFYAHHDGLASLRASALGSCPLCTLIWQSWSRDIPAAVLEQEWLAPAATAGREQIYLGLSSWAPAGSGPPYLTAKQFTARGAERALGTFEVYAARGQVPPGCGHLLARDVQASPASEAAFALARGWLATCVAGHARCGPRRADEAVLPTRVLDLGAPEAPGPPAAVRLLVSGGASGFWVALSYCWGGPSEFVLTKANLEVWQRGVPLQEFPATLRDAVVITRRLGVRYLWIDALCIKQDDTDDWATEAAGMERVYRGAYLTIAAANSASSDGGILRDREPTEPPCQLAWKQDGRSTLPVFVRSGSALWDASMRTSRLRTRGWTLQEAVLSRRVLSYGPQQLAWECQELHVDESGRPFAPGHSEHHDQMYLLHQSFGAAPRWDWRRALAHVRLAGFPNPRQTAPRWPYDRWLELVREFSARELTVATDVLPAMSGLAFGFSFLLNHDGYHAGLWEGDILRGLMWSCGMPKTPAAAVPQARALPDGYRVPSWSWASVRGSFISHLHAPADGYWAVERQAKILGVRTESLFKDPWGQTKGGCLHIESAFRQIRDPRHPAPEAADGTLLEKALSDEYARVDRIRSEFDQQHRTCADQHFAALLLSHHYRDSQRESQVRKRWTRFPVIVLLVLETTGASSEEYRRVGLFVHRSSGSSLDDRAGMEIFDDIKKQDWKIRRVKIV